MKLYVKTKNNVKLFVESLNPEGKHTILFIHGWPLNHNMWEYYIDYFSQFNYHCVTVDLRGYGNSDRPINGYDYDSMASDIKSVIDTLKLKNITLVGYGMGGAIAIRYVAKYNASSISNLCLISIPAPSFVQTDDWPTGISQDNLASLAKQCYLNRPDLITILKGVFFYKYISSETGQWFSNMCLDSAGWATGSSLLAMGEAQLANDLKMINIKTLIVHGVYDHFVPFTCAEYMRDNIKDSTLIDLLHSGHATFLEENDRVSEEIDKFIRQNANPQSKQ